MRSDLVFTASGRVSNRYLLCRLVRVPSRKFHKPGVPMQETISKVFGLVSAQASSNTTVETRAAWESSFSSRTTVNQNLESKSKAEMAKVS
jgi:hypothetical protein